MSDAPPERPVADAHANYLHDVGLELREQAVAAVSHARGHREDAFAQGVAHGYYVVLSVMVQQAEAFLIPRDSLGLQGLDPDRDLL